MRRLIGDQWGTGWCPYPVVTGQRVWPLRKETIMIEQEQAGVPQWRRLATTREQAALVAICDTAVGERGYAQEGMARAGVILVQAVMGETLATAGHAANVVEAELLAARRRRGVR